MAVVVEYTETALGAETLQRAQDEARLRKLPLVLVGAVPMPRTGDEGSTWKPRRDKEERRLRERAAQLTSADLPCDVFVPPSPVGRADAVRQAADAKDAALVVVGIPRRSPVGKLLLGSAEQEILLGVECPVLGVKLDEANEGR